jgi:hypothetical protein
MLLRPLKGKCRKGVYTSRATGENLMKDLDVLLSRDAMKETFQKIAVVTGWIFALIGLLSLFGSLYAFIPFAIVFI